MSLSQTADEMTVDERLDAVSAELAEIRKTLDFIEQTIVKADTTITKVAAEVMPTINQLMESPMIKMLAGKKKS